MINKHKTGQRLTRMLIGIIFFTSQLAPLLAGETANIPNSFHLKLESRFAENQSEFRGSVQVSRFDVSIDQDGGIIPNQFAMQLVEYRVSEAANEVVSLTWKPPLRRDLTPDIRYTQYRQDFAVTIHGNSRGPRAVIHHPPATDQNEESFIAFLSNICGYLAGNEINQIVENLQWKKCNVSGEVWWTDQSGSGMDHEMSEAELFTATSGSHESNIQKVNAQVLNLNNDVRGEGESVSAESESITLQPASLDICAELVDYANPDWNGVTMVAYRVVEWQKLVSKDAQDSAVIVPRLVLWEEMISRPKMPFKSYHRFSLLLISINQSPEIGLVADWKKFLPNMRIANLLDGTSQLNGITDRNGSTAWPYIRKTSAGSGEFLSLIQDNLTQEVAKLRRWTFITTDANTVRHSAFYLMGRSDFPVAMPSSWKSLISNEGDNVAVATTGNANSLTSQPESSLDYGKDHPLKENKVGKPAVSLNATVKQSGNDSDDESTIPALFFVFDKIQSHAVESTNTIPARAGYEPVTKKRQKKARQQLALMLLAGGSVLAGIAVVSYLRRNKSFWCRLITIAGPLACFILPSGLIFGAEPGLQARAGLLPLPSKQLTKCASALIEKHVEIVGNIRNGPEVDAELLSNRIVFNHKAIIAEINLSTPIIEEISPRLLMRGLDRTYKSINTSFSRESFRTAELPADLSMLHSALFNYRADCYSLGLLYLIHARLCNVPVRMVAIPGHIVLYIPSEHSQNLMPRCSGGICGMEGGEFYDPIKSTWIAFNEAPRTYSILNDQQIGAIAAFNLGTRIAQHGDVETGSILLAKSISLDFPFPEAIKNRCLTLVAQAEYQQVVETLRQMTCLRHPISLSEMTLREQYCGPRKRLDDIFLRQCAKDLNNIYVHALVKAGHRADAMIIARQVLERSAADTDFQLYRLFIGLKTGSYPNPHEVVEYMPRAATVSPHGSPYTW